MRQLTVATLLLAAAVLSFADAPRRVEELVYTVRAYDGNAYISTFAREESPALYIGANRNTILVARKSLVYYWAITDEWRVDTETLNRAMSGELVVTARGAAPRVFSRVPFTIYRRQGLSSGWEVATEEAAWSLYDEFRESYNQYLEDLRAYNREADEFARRTIELAEVIVAEREAGRDISRLLEEFRIREAPNAPRLPDTYTVPPTEPQLAFVVNLPEGEFSIALRDEDGRTVEGSERSLISFVPEVSDWTGIEVIPADRWTRPVQSQFPGTDIYVDGSVDVFLRPFIQNRYNEYEFAKLRDNDAQASPEASTWVRHSDLADALIELTTRSNSSTISGAAFAVDPVESATPGYRIRALAEQQRSESPDLIAHPVDILQATWNRAELTVIGRDGQPLPGGTRELRIIDSERIPPWTLLFAGWPIFLLLGVRFTRRRRAARGRE